MGQQHLHSYVGQAKVEIHSAIAQLNLLLKFTPHNSNMWAPTRAMAIEAQCKLERAQQDLEQIARWLPT